MLKKTKQKTSEQKALIICHLEKVLLKQVDKKMLTLKAWKKMYNKISARLC